MNIHWKQTENSLFSQNSIEDDGCIQNDHNSKKLCQLVLLSIISRNQFIFLRIFISQIEMTRE